MGTRRTQSIGAVTFLALLAAAPALANPDVEAARGETFALLAIPVLLFAIIAIEVLVIRLALHPPRLWQTVIGANALSAFIGLAAVVVGPRHPWLAYGIGYLMEIGILVAAWRSLGPARVAGIALGANVLSTAAFFLLLLPGWHAFTNYVSLPRVPLTEAAHWGPASLSYRGRDQWMSFDATDAGHAWLLRMGLGLVRSTDGGRHWQQLREFANTVDFVSADVGWAERGSRTARDPAPSVGRTIDGGRTWQWHRVDKVEITALAAVDAREAWVATASVEWPPKVRAGLVRTRDGGRSWQPIPIPPAGRIRAMAFADREHGWLIADPAEGVPETPESLTVLHTSDGGRTFQSALTPPLVLAPPAAGVTTRAIRLLSPREAWIAAGSSWLLHTRDGGQTWEVVRPSVPEGKGQPHLLGCWFLSPQIGWAVGHLGRGSALALATRDGGRTWTRLNTGAEKIPNGYFDRVFFADEAHGWLCGGSGDKPVDYPPFHITQFVLRYRP